MPLHTLPMTILLDSEDGPVGRLVAGYASIIRDLARGNAGDIIVSMPTGEFEAKVAPSIDFVQAGTTAIVGIEETEPPPGKKESIETYLANKEQRELVWLFPAAAEAFAKDNQAEVTRLLGFPKRR